MSKSEEQTKDIFDSALNLEDSQLQQGYEEGYRDGVQAGKVEGREVGWKVGFQLGEELGFYQGCTNVWKAAMSRSPSGAFSARCRRSIALFDEQLTAYPLTNPNDERLQDLLETIRARFRAILAMLSVQIQYEGYQGSKVEADTSSF